MSGELYGAVKVPTAQFPFDLAIFLLVALELLFHLILILLVLWATAWHGSESFLKIVVFHFVLSKKYLLNTTHSGVSRVFK